jgi:hypothetical protein
MNLSDTAIVTMVLYNRCAVMVRAWSDENLHARLQNGVNLRVLPESDEAGIAPLLKHEMWGLGGIQF